MKDDFNYLLYAYMKEAKTFKMLSQEEEIAYAKLAKNGDKEAINRLVTANLGLVTTIAIKYVEPGIQLLDLINEGNLGLLIAARKFDFNKGCKFCSYAYWWVRHKIVRFKMNVSKEKILLDNELPIQCDNSMLDDLFENELAVVLKDAFNALNVKEQDILSRSYELYGMTRKRDRELAEMYGVTRQRMQQIRKDALGKMKLVLEPILA